MTTGLPANQVHAELRKLADSPANQGRLFERVIAGYFRQAPLYRDQLKNVRLWKDWSHEHGIDGRDAGIDLVADTRDGEYWAIQCKCYAENHPLQKSDIDSFLSATGRAWQGKVPVTFSRALIVSTTPNWSNPAEHAISARTPPCIRLDLTELTWDEGIDWSTLLPELDLERPAPRQLRPHQTVAVNAVIRGFEAAARGQLIMACGTGKTYTALEIAARQVPAGGTVLFLTPSISLLSQTLREWAAHHPWQGIRTFAVCSDSKVGRTNEDLHAYDMAIPPTTDGQKLAEGLTRALPPGHVQLVFATYHSIGVAHDAQQWGAPAFDLVVCDEAHRTTGVDLKDQEASYYTRVHDEAYLQAHKRLYMTATPRIYKDSAKKSARENAQVAAIYSMDDETRYGATFHRLDFSEAVAKDLLSDYKVLVLMVNQAHANAALHELLAMIEHTNLNDAARLIGCWNGLSKRIAEQDAPALTDTAPMRRAVAFCQSIAASKQVAQCFAEIAQAYQDGSADDDPALHCAVRHVDGTQNALKRNQALQWLRDEPDENQCRILSNVRCLSEGVDVPALDAALFLSPRSSQVDVVQAVGRVMRKAPGKEYGYIILPVCVDPEQPPEQALQDDKTYKVVWQVLQALRAHDNRFNAEINKIELNKQREGRINVIGVGFDAGADGDDDRVNEPPSPPYTLPLRLEDWKEALYARLVLKCGDRRYWESWAKDVADIASRNVTRIHALVDDSARPEYRDLFKEFLAELRQNLNPAVSEADAVEMLSQHLITRPVFDALFENYAFIDKNPVSRTMQAMLELLDEQNLDTGTNGLERFYESVRQRASGIDNAAGRQRVVIELYEKFFKEAFPKMAESLGIVYTPLEVVDFILHSVNDLLQREFGQTLGSEHVHILDPFTGTGTFLTRLLGSNLIADSALERKYRTELHANELVLLAYYIAAVNIEETYHERLTQKYRRTGQQGADYESFPGIVLTDTFHINERDGDMLQQIFDVNPKRVMAQKKAPIRVILGNPPYSAKQRSANDNNANLSYEKLDDSIAASYVAHSRTTNKNSLYDSYIRAFRWASNRIGEDGIIAYISNGGWLDGNAMDGFRRCLGAEFDRIYCFNLRGNQRTAGDVSRREGGKIFGSGSRAGITLTFLVKKKSAGRRTCQIRYHDIGDYLKREEKLEKIRTFQSILNPDCPIPWRTITPNRHHDWISSRNEVFLNYLPLGDDKNKKGQQPNMPSIFTAYSRGVGTSRDLWAYHFSKDILAKNMQKTIAFYNGEVERYRQACQKKDKEDRPQVADFIQYDVTRISWFSSLKKCLGKMEMDHYNFNDIRQAVYRPFTKQNLYFNNTFTNESGIVAPFFPSPNNTENRTICVHGKGGNKPFSALMVNITPDLNCLDAGTQCFPRYRYLPPDAQSHQATLSFDKKQETAYKRVDNIPQETVEQFQNRYQNVELDTNAVFYYVYGILHSPDYRTRFAADLKKMLPRIPFVNDYTTFQAFSHAGKTLADLHVHYEQADPYPLDVRRSEADVDEKTRYRVEKMRFGGTSKKPDRTVILYNPHVTIEGIPGEVHDYIVNGKTALEWIMERYQITRHKESKIINDPNQWSNNPRYILELLQRVITVSLKTVETVRSLPKLTEETNTP